MLYDSNHLPLGPGGAALPSVPGHLGLRRELSLPGPSPTARVKTGKPRMKLELEATSGEIA